MGSLRDQILAKWIETLRADAALDPRALADLERAFQGADGAVDRETLLRVVRAAQASR